MFHFAKHQNSVFQRYLKARAYRTSKAKSRKERKHIQKDLVKSDQDDDLGIIDQISKLKISQDEQQVKAQEVNEHLQARTIATAVSTKHRSHLTQSISTDNSPQVSSALRWAIINKDFTTVQKLLQEGADVHAFDQSQPLLITALDIRANEIVPLLLGHAKTLDGVQNAQGNIVHAVVRNGDLAIVKFVLDHVRPEVINARSSTLMGSTPLHEAVRYIKVKQITNTFPRVWGQCNHDLGVIESLLSKGSDVNAKDTKGRTALHLSVLSSQTNATEMLLKAGANPTAVDDNNHTPFMYAALHPDNHFMELFKPYQPTKFQPLTLDGKYHIHLACMAGNVLVVKYLLTSGCDVNVRYNSRTPLMLAIEKGNYECAECLLKNDSCDVSLTDNDGFSALHVMLQQDTQKRVTPARILTPAINLTSARIHSIFALFKQKGCDFDKPRKSYGLPPLFYHLQGDRKEWFPYLIEYGADVNYVTSQNEYPLLIACYINNTNFVTLLLKYNLNMALSSLASKRSNSRTPFQCALHNRNLALIRLLLKEGCYIQGTLKWLRTHPGSICGQFLRHNDPSIYEYIKSIAKSPQRLQDLAKCTIRRAIGFKNTLAKYDSLPLPNALKTSLRSYEKHCDDNIYPMSRE